MSGEIGALKVRTGPNSWAIVGGAGAKGDKGDAGPTGPPGATGATGAQGTPGSTGATGSQGPAGIGIPPGGAALQVLAKIDSTNYNVGWVNQTGAAGSGLTDGDKGDIIVSGSGATFTFDSTVITAAARTLLDDPDVTAMRTTLGAQAADSDLTIIAALAPANDTIIQRKGGVWVASLPATVKTDLALTKADVGLGSVDNTTDLAKPISTATQTALNAKQPLDTDLTQIASLTATTGNMILSAGSAWTSADPVTVKTALALNNVDNTTDAGKPVSAATLTALNLKADKATTFTGTAPIKIDGFNTGRDLSANRTISVDLFTATTAGTVPTGGINNTNFLRGDATWANPHNQITLDTYFRTGHFVSGGSGAAPTRQIRLSYGGSLNYPHEILTTHNSGSDPNNSIVFRTWKFGDPTLGPPSNTILTLESSVITAAKPVALPSGDPTQLLHAAHKQYVDAQKDAVQVLTNKTINLTNNTLQGTATQFNIANTDSDFYTTGGVDVAVADGGTGRSTNSIPNGIIAAGVTALDPFTTIAPGTVGQFLKSQGTTVQGAFANIVQADVTNLVTDLLALSTGKADKTITITATSPITGGGTLANSFSIGINAASTTVIGATRLSTPTEATDGLLATIAVTPVALATGYLKLAGGTITPGSLNITGNTAQLTFGSRLGQHINLYSTSYGFGIQSSATYQRTADSFYWYLAGIHNDAKGNPGGGTTLLTLNTTTFSYKTSKVWTAADNGHTVDNSGINADRLDSKHAAEFADREEMEALLGDLLYVGLYDAASYVLPLIPGTASPASDATKPKPLWSGGNTVYRSGMYWVCASQGTLDFIDADFSGRYDQAVTYQVTNKSLTANVATLTITLHMSDDVVPVPIPHNISSTVGPTQDSIIVTLGDPLFDGKYLVTATTANTVSFALVGANVASTPVVAGEMKVVNDGSQEVHNGDWIVAVDPEAVAGQPPRDLVLTPEGTTPGPNAVTFQWIPFSSETYVKNQILAHIAAADPHQQYLRQEEGDVLYAPVVHNHQAEIRQQVINHQIQDPWVVSGWSWSSAGTITLTVDPRHSILPGSYINLTNVAPALNGKWRVLDTETDPTLITFAYSTTAPPGYTVPVTIPDPGGQVYNDPHSQYLDAAEADALYLTEARADELYADIVHNHDTLYEKLGAVASHEALADPHPGYLTPAEGDIAYAIRGHTHSEILEVHPTDGANSADIWIGDQPPTVANGVAIGDLWIETPPIGLQVPTVKALTVSNGATGISVVLSWQQWAASEFVSTISLERGTDGTTFPTVLTTTASLITWTDTGLTANTTYYYRIKAANASAANAGGGVGQGLYSPTASIVTKPAAVTGVIAASSSATDAHVSWTAAIGGSGYQYEVYVNGVLKTTQAGVTYTAPAVTENTSVTFGIRAKGSSGLFATTVSDTTTSLNADPVQPASITMSAVDHDSAVATWVASTSPDRKDYEVYLGSALKTTTTALSYTFTGLAASTPYTFQVRTRDTGLRFSPYRSTTATTAAPPDTTPPPAPTIQRFAPETSYGRMLVDFTLGTGTQDYRVDKSIDNANWTTVVAWTAGTGVKTNIVVGTYSNVAPYPTVYCRVYARDAAGNSTYVNAPAYTLIASPTYITASDTDHYRANGTWNAMSTSRPVQGYYNNTAYNATGLWFYNNKPTTTLYYGGRRTIMSGKILLKRMDGGSFSPVDVTLSKHQLLTAPTSGAPSLFIETDLDANVPAYNGAAVSVALPDDWANQLVNGTTYKGLAVHKPTSDNGASYTIFANLADYPNTGRLEIHHLG